MQFLSWLGGTLRRLGALIFPAVGKARAAAPGMARGLLWFLHFLVLALVLVGLYFLNQRPRVLEMLPVHPRIKPFWLPILGLLFYLLCWLAWWLWQLLAVEEEPSHFPDIDEAWEAAKQALARAGLGLTELPLFFVLGRPDAGEPGMMGAAKLPLPVNGEPGGDAPVRAYAGRDALFVTCAGASVLGRQAAVLAGSSAGSLAAPFPAAGGGEFGEESTDKTLEPTKAPLAAQRIKEIVARAERGGRELTGDERRALRAIERRDKPHASLLRNPDEVELQTARLRHLCRLIARDRHPYTSVNGVLLLVPFAGTYSDQDATDTGDVCRRDLETLRQALRVDCPLLALVCDLENADGFAEFVGRFSAKELQSRIGQRHPLLPDFGRKPSPAGAGADPLAESVEGLVRWVCGTTVPRWVYQKFRLEKEGEDVTEVVRGNARLFLFGDEMRSQQARLGTILARAVGGEAGTRFGGCYLAGTGKEAAEQGFVAGVLRRLIDEQSHVAWTPEVIEEEATYRRWTQIGWPVLVLLALVAAGLVTYSLLAGSLLAGKGG
jgi:hypothetical protein